MTKRTSRRVTTPPPAGSDPNPGAEPPRQPSERGDGTGDADSGASGSGTKVNTSNDARLKADKPPHY